MGTQIKYFHKGGGVLLTLITYLPHRKHMIYKVKRFAAVTDLLLKGTNVVKDVYNKSGFLGKSAIIAGGTLGPGLVHLANSRPKEEE